MNILLVDDKYDVLQGIANGVNWNEIGDIKLFFASSGIEALEIIEHQAIQLLITDIEMPGISGLDLAEKLHREKKDIATVFLTSHDSFRYAQTAIRIGCCDYILQPVDYEKLQEAIIRVINNRLTQQIEKAWNNSVNEKQELERNRQNAWRKILVKVPQYDLNTMQEILEKTQLFFNSRQSFRIILIALLWRKESLDSWTSHAEDDCFLKIKKAIAKDFPVAAGFEVDMTTWCIILEDPEKRNIPLRLQPFVRVETKEGVSSLAFYVSERTKLENLPETYQKLQKLSNNNVGKYAGVYEYRECEDSHNEELVTCDIMAINY